MQRSSRLAALVLAGALLLPGCALLDKQHKPVPNLSATRASGAATAVRGATPSPALSSSPGPASPSRGSAVATPSATPTLAGTAEAVTATGWGPVAYGQVATASPTVVWLEACQGWALRSSGGTVLGHAKTKDGTPASSVFALRLDALGVAGPGGVTVGGPASEFSAVHPDAARGDAKGTSFLWTLAGPTTFVAQVDKTQRVTALMVLPPGQSPTDFSAAPLCA